MKQYKSPTGSPIVGTLENIPGCAPILGFNDDGTPEYAGETELLWDYHKTVQSDGKIIFLDDDGAEWTFDQLEEDDDNDD